MHQSIRIHELPSVPLMHHHPAKYAEWKATNAARWERRPYVFFTAHDGEGEHMQEAQRLNFGEWTSEVDAWIGRMSAKLAKDWKHVSLQVVPGSLKA